MKVYKFAELFENVAVHKSIKNVQLPYCSILQTKGYRIANINGDYFAFTKNYDVDDEVYWLGETDLQFVYGKKYIATEDLLLNKEKLPFYSLYSKCDNNLTPEQQKLKLQLIKDNQKRNEQKRKEIEREKELKRNKKKRR